MQLDLYDSTFKWFGLIDSFSSLIWTDRYNVPGDFEVLLIPSLKNLSLFGSTSYVKLKESGRIMIPEIINLKSDAEQGNRLIVKGRSLESILDRRIVWDPTVLTGNFQTGIQQLLNENVINATITDRRITNFQFQASTDPIITALTINTQVTGQYLLKVISDLCVSRNIGFKVTLNSSGNFVFELYAGVDRTNDQFINPSIVFSQKLDNLLNSDYIATDQFLKTVVLVAGEEGVGNIRTTVVVESEFGAGSGLGRREIYKEANDVSRNPPSGQLSEAEYLLLLEGRGVEELWKNTFIESFDGEVDTKMFNYGEDFFMGDILQLEDNYGHSGKSRVTEVIYSQDSTGIKIYPTFTTIIE